MKSLIVDDNKTVQVLLKGLLNPYGRCDVASNGMEALEAFRSALEKKQGYNLVVMDVLMPEMDGIETIRRIREIERLKKVSLVDEVKIIMLTYIDDPVDITEAGKERVNAYILKPVDADTLYKELKRNSLV